MVAGFLQVRHDRVRLIRQVHGAGVAVARRGGPDEWGRPEADVIVSDDPDAAIGVRVADCAPILLADRRRGVVGAAHAGWRGTVQRAAIAAVDAMVREFGSAPSDLVAAIGPCLGACCGEVGEEVVRAFEDAGHRDVGRWFTTGPTPKPYLDLARANVDQLTTPAWIRRAFMSRACARRPTRRCCTRYRADGTAAGRMVGIIRTSPGAARTR